MHARLTRFEGSPDQVEAGTKLIQETVIPAARKLPGFKGGVWMVDRTSGKGFGLTVFENEAAVRATEDAAAQIRSAASETTKITGVERYEVVAEATPRSDSAAARVTNFEGSPEQADALITFTKETVVPGAKALEGFAGGYWLLDRANGKGVAVTLFESAEARQASEAFAAQTRTDATELTSAKMTGVERYEVVAQAVPEAAATRG
jgi:hypothetical protein